MRKNTQDSPIQLLSQAEKDLINDESKQTLAADRTIWAYERVLLAKERTFSAWMRTGLAAMATGFGAAQFAPSLHPQWLIYGSCILLIIAGAFSVIIGYLSYRKTDQALKNLGIHGVPSWAIAALAITLTLVGCAGITMIMIN